MLFCLWISVLFGHTKINNVNNVRSFGVGSADEEVVWFDVSIYQILLVYRLHSRELEGQRGQLNGRQQTICFATITTVLMENLRLQ